MMGLLTAVEDQYLGIKGQKVRVDVVGVKEAVLLGRMGDGCFCCEGGKAVLAEEGGGHWDKANY